MKKIAATIIIISLLFFVFTSEKKLNKNEQDYVCTPCGADCDATVHSGPGTCSKCGMSLVKKDTITHKNIKPEDLCSFVTKQGNNVLLLDVRTPAEFEGKAGDKYGRLKNAINIQIQELEKRMN